MHSESRVIHEVAVGLFKECGPRSNDDFELRHKVIIDRLVATCIGTQCSGVNPRRKNLHSLLNQGRASRGGLVDYVLRA